MLRGWWLLLILAACVPATEPAQLDFTPGAPVVVSERMIDAGDFHAEYPDGWRVITSTAGQPLSVILVAPGDCALIVISTVLIERPPALAESCGESRAETRRLLDGRLYAAGSVAPIAAWGDFLPVFERVSASVTAAAV